MSYQILEKQLRGFPWATLGRPESLKELLLKWEEQKGHVEILTQHPRVSIVVRAASASEGGLQLTLASLIAQSYPHWEALVVGGLPGKVQDKRIRYFPSEDNAIQAACGEWLCFANAEDVFSPVALYFFITESFREPKASVLYAHELQVDQSRQKVGEAISKPAYSWFDLIHFNYVGRAWMIRRSLWLSLSPKSELEVFLRADEAGEAFRLVPYFLYYRKNNFKLTVGEEEKIIVQQHLVRKKIPASVSLDGDGRGRKLIVRPELSDPSRELVSVIICFKDKSSWTIKSLEQVVRFSGNVPLEIFLINNNSCPEELAAVKEALNRVPWPVQMIDYTGPFNFAEMHNQVVGRYAKGKYLLLLNNDVFLKQGTVEDLVRWAQWDWVGTVGVCLQYPHGDIQHGGFRAFFGGLARLARVGHDHSETQFTFQNREVFGNTFAACLMKRETFNRLGGLRPGDLPNGFGDVAFNFECIRRGLKCLFLGHVLGVHLESASRGEGYEYWEEYLIEREYPDILQKMLREDLGTWRVPNADISARDFVVDWLTVRARENLPWLKPLKSRLKKRLRDLGLRGDNELLKLSIKDVSPSNVEREPKS